MISLADKLLSSRRLDTSAGYFLSFTSGSLMTISGKFYKNADGSVIAYSVAVVDTIPYSVIIVTDATGSVLWQRKITDTTETSKMGGIAIDASGNVYCAVTNNATDQLAHVIKYNSSGTIQWQRKLSASGYDVNYAAIGVDSSGNVYVAGTRTTSDRNQGILAKYNSSGTIQWQKSLSVSGALVGINGLAMASTGDVFVCGGQGTQAYGLVAKYNNAGGRAATATFRMSGMSYSSPIFSIGTDTSDNVYVALYNGDPGDFGYEKCYVSKFNASLAPQWHKKIGNAGTATYTYSGGAISADSSNVVIQVHNTSAPYAEYMVAISQSSGDSVWIRKLTVYADATTTSILGINAGTSLMLAGSGKVNGSTTNGFAGVLPASDTLGTYGTAFTMAEPSALTISTSTYASGSPTYVDADAGLTEAAGSLTDAAASITVTKHT